MTVPLSDYVWFGAPGLLKMVGAFLLIAPLPVQHFLMPENIQLRRNNEIFEAQIENLSFLNIRNRIELEANRKEIAELSVDARGKVYAETIDELTNELSHAEKEIADIEARIGLLEDVRDERQTDIEAQSRLINLYLFCVSMLGGAIGLSGMWIENHRKILKEYREEAK